MLFIIKLYARNSIFRFTTNSNWEQFNETNSVKLLYKLSTNTKHCLENKIFTNTQCNF